MEICSQAGTKISLGFFKKNSRKQVPLKPAAGVGLTGMRMYVIKEKNETFAGLSAFFNPSAFLSACFVAEHSNPWPRPLVPYRITPAP